MDCEEFLESYSDFLDRRLEQRPLSEYREHLLSCGSCSRYDRVVQRGLREVRELPSPRTGEDFLLRLQHRLFHVRDPIHGGVGQLRRAAAVGTAAVAALILIASLPVLGAPKRTVELPPVVIEAPAREEAESSLWELVPGPAANLLVVPELDSGPWHVRQSELSLFRTRAGRSPLLKDVGSSGQVGE